MDDQADGILAEQIAYYRARAPEYDEWFLRQGRYDHGEVNRRQWFDELRVVEAALAERAPAGDILELACGTGLWTRQLVANARRVTAVDASPEVLALNRAQAVTWRNGGRQNATAAKRLPRGETTARQATMRKAEPSTRAGANEFGTVRNSSELDSLRRACWRTTHSPSPLAKQEPRP